MGLLDDLQNKAQDAADVVGGAVPDGIKDAAAGAADNVQNVAGNVADAAQGAVDAVGNAVPDGVKDAAGNVIDGAKDLAGNAGEAIDGVVDKAKDMFGGDNNPTPPQQ